MNNEYLPFLRELSENLLQQRDWKKLIQEILPRLGTLLEGDKLVIARAVPNGDEISFQVREAWWRDEMVDRAQQHCIFDDIALGEGPDTIMATLKDFKSLHLQKDPWLESRGIEDFLLFPIVRGSLLWGTISVIRYNPRETSWTTEDFDFLWTVVGVLSSRLGELDIHEMMGKEDRVDSGREQFFTQLTHDLKTPLNGILGYAQVLLRRGDQDEFSINCLNLIEKSGQSLLHMIDNILSISRGKGSLHRQKEGKSSIKGLTAHREKTLINQSFSPREETSVKVHYSVPSQEILLKLKASAEMGEWKSLEDQIGALDPEFAIFKKEASVLINGFHVEGFKALVNQLITRAS